MDVVDALGPDHRGVVDRGVLALSCDISKPSVAIRCVHHIARNLAGIGIGRVGFAGIDPIALATPNRAQVVIVIRGGAHRGGHCPAGTHDEEGNGQKPPGAFPHMGILKRNLPRIDRRQSSIWSLFRTIAPTRLRRLREHVCTR